MAKHIPTMKVQPVAQTTEPTTPKPSCLACRFYRPAVNGTPGRCRRFPPLLSNPLGYGAQQHPQVLPCDWCGEFAAK